MSSAASIGKTRQQQMHHHRAPMSLPVIQRDLQAYKDGICAFNIDGACVSGGLTAPTGKLGGDGGGGGTCGVCNTLPLWYQSGTPYHLIGVNVRTNRKAMSGHGGVPGALPENDI